MDRVSDLHAWQYRALSAELLAMRHQLANLHAIERERVTQIQILLGEMRASVGAEPTAVYDPHTQTFASLAVPRLVQAETKTAFP